MNEKNYISIDENFHLYNDKLEEHSFLECFIDNSYKKYECEFCNFYKMEEIKQNDIIEIIVEEEEIENDKNNETE